MDLIGRRYDTGELIRLEVAGDKVHTVTPITVDPRHPNDHPWIAPVLCDLQVNGYGGQEFSSPTLTPEAVQRIARQMDAFGVARSCPTVTTNGPEVMLHAVRTIAAACEASPAVAYGLPGIHVEGPFISPIDGPRGAHPLAYVRPPDWDEFQRLQEAAGGRIRILTLSPEYDGAAAFIRRVADTGVIVAIGHTAATPEQVRAAADAGATMSTHLGNGAHALIPRHRSYLWAQLADDRLTAGLIVDGHHLPPDVVKTFLRAKTPARCVLVSDISGLAGLAPGRHHSEMCELEILPGGKLVVAGQSELLAGASAPLGTCVANVLRFGEVSLAEAIGMAAIHPARLLGIQPGGLDPGDPADLVLFDLIRSDGEQPPRFEVRRVLIHGEPCGVR
jgi:N-acetylglucosamine-6-phosphate deacetylase